MNINFFVQPNHKLTLPFSVSVEATYVRDVPAAEGEPADSTPQTIRVLLDGRLSGAAVLEDAATREVRADVLSFDGSRIFSRTVRADDSNNATLVFTDEELKLLSQIPQAVPTDKTPRVCTRTVRLVPTGQLKPDYARSAVVVSPVSDEQAPAIRALDPLLKIEGNTNKITSLDLTGQQLGPLTRVDWAPAHLSVDGTFNFSYAQQPSIGWFWWLTGEHQVVGFVPDDLSARGECGRKLAVALPVLSAPGKTPAGGEGSSDCECEKTVPVDVTEEELANNPEIYTEDPGAFCKPFNNPERVLSEKSFSVIARVEQPEIGAGASNRTKSIGLLNLDALSSAVATSNANTGFFTRLANVFSPAAARPIAVGAPLTPKRHTLPGDYVGLVKRLASARHDMDSRNPLQWEDEIAQYQAATVSLGHILEYRVRWRSNGYSLGTVAKTLTLAPRQAMRIQKIEWERSDRARRSERTLLTDVENDTVTRERDFQDEVSANLSEWARGGSHSDTEAVAGGIGFFLSGVLGGIGGGAGSSNSTSHQEGGRSTAASEHQRLRDAIRRHGDALRKFESTVVNEVAQEETVTGTTEVIRNLNYAHSLTVIYYQILRHLKVSTEFAGARECLFVPFAIRAFDTQRAYRWREAIQVAIRSRRYLRALRYLKDVATNFATSDIPPGTRSEEPLTYLRGSIFVDLAIERPRDTAEGAFDEARWLPFAGLFGEPPRSIIAQMLQQLVAARDRFFQTNYAPGMAAKWANSLRLRIGGSTITVDSTLATRYHFNRGVRIDFVVPPERLSGLRRRDLQSLTVVTASDLPPGSVANLTGLSLTYNTARFQRTVRAQTGVNDLVIPETGVRDAATVLVPLDHWEVVDERLEITRSVQDLVEHLNEHVEYYHKAIWWHMDRDRLLMLLDGFYVPHSNQVSIASVVDREPVGIIGNCLVYRVGAASFIGYGEVKTPADLYNLYAEKQPIRDPVLVSLPTDGLYAQTIMDECLALEEHYGNLDWALNDADPELGFLDPSLLTSRRADTTTATTPTPFPSTIINLQNAPEAPAPSGLQGVLNAVTTADAFRDMAGLAATQANALAALNTAAGLATNFGNQAAALELAKVAKSKEATRSADQKLATIERAKQKGLTSEAEAAAQTREVLSSMNPDTPKGEAPHENAAINSAIEAAKSVPGSTIEATTGEGAVKVEMGGGKDDLFSNPIIIDVNVTPSLRAFGPSSNLTGKTKLSVKGKNLPSGTQLRWSIPTTEAGKYTITQHVTASGISEVEITGIRPGLSEIDIEAIDSGVVIASQKHPLSIPQFVAVNDSNADFDTFITNNTFDAIRDGILDEAKRVIELLLLKEANVRLVWASTGTPVPPHIPADLVTRVVLGNTDPSGDNNYGSSDPGPASGGNVGDTAFDEIVSLFPASYLVAGGGSDVNAAANDLMRILTDLQASDPLIESWLIRFFGRMIGETMSHELYHTLLPVPFVHNVDGAGNEHDTGDIMDAGSFRSFFERTGIVALSTAPADFIDNLTDNSITAINKLTDANLSHVHTHFPVPPTAPFDK